jgi:hypothetical protein
VPGTKALVSAAIADAAANASSTAKNGIAFSRMVLPCGRCNAGLDSILQP